MFSTQFKQFVVVICGALCVLSPARATTFVLMDEPTLLHSSTAVLIGTVTAIESAAPDPNGAIYTYVHIQPHRILRGRIGKRHPLILREPGGTVGDRREWIFGAPEFWVGERALLFLTRNSDGTLQTNSLAMGKFTLAVDANGHTIAVRHFGYGASVMVPENGQILEAQPQSQRFVSLLSRLRTLAQRDTAETTQPVTLTPTELATTPTVYHDSFTYLSNPPMRWFQPDSGRAVNYVIDSTGDQKLGFATSRAAIDSALAAWTNVLTSNLILGDGGTADCSTPSNCTFGPCDANRIVFNDPNSEITDPSGCSGILAIGGYCGGGGSKVVNGTTFNQITVGKVTFNNGWSACSFWNQCNMAEVATHEIGHTIGLGHSADGTATMAATAHFDGRCAGLAADDTAAVNFIYPQVGTSPPTATATRTPTITSTRPPTQTPTITPTSTMTQTRAATWTAGQTPIVTSTFTPGPPTSTFTQTLPPTATFTAAPPAPPPAGLSNDTCASAITIASTPYNGTAITTTATTDGTDPFPGCGNGSRGRSVWYRFTAPSSGPLTVNTFGSSYDTILAAYTGSCGAFSPVSRGCNDDAGGTSQSQVSFTATAGTTYYFMATSYTNVTGTLHLQLTFQGSGSTATPTATSTPRPPTATFTAAPPTATFTAVRPTATFTQTQPPTATFTAGPPTATFTLAPSATATMPPTSTQPPAATPTSQASGVASDTCAAATNIASAPYIGTSTTTTASTEGSDPFPGCGNGSRGRSVWYRFTAPRTGPLTASTLGSSYDTILSAYTGTCGAFTRVSGGCNDDASGTMQSQVSFTATAGTTYYFMVTAYSNAGGTLVFRLTF